MPISILPEDKRDPASILRHVADYFEVKPEAWIQGGFARTAAGLPVASDDEEAVCYCLAGALRAACDCVIERLKATAVLREMLDGERLVSWNDAPGRTVEEVITTLRKTADLAEAGAA